jgi:hypothetical protein
MNIYKCSNCSKQYKNIYYYKKHEEKCNQDEIEAPEEKENDFFTQEEDIETEDLDSSTDDDSSLKFDQFYTKEEVAKKCYETFKTKINIDNYDIILEPSAGKGSFFKLLPVNKREGIDLVPKYDGILKKNFFEYIPKNKKYITIGNPPFGRVSSIAIKFFNKAAEFSDVIAFIIPRTFKRTSVTNKLNMNFRMIYNEDLPLDPCCFEPKMSAKCCFQIWEKSLIKRKKIVYDKTHTDFTFLKFNEKNNSDFCIKAYGSNCGEVVDLDLDSLSYKSWHWIKSNIDINLLKNRFKLLDYSMSKDTVRQDSIGQQELIYLYKLKFN